MARGPIEELIEATSPWRILAPKKIVFKILKGL
jgi:hypothetical protein